MDRVKWHGVVVAMVVAYGWWATGLEAFSLEVYAAVAVPVAVGLVAASGGGPTPVTGARPQFTVVGRLMWPILAGVVAGWQLFLYLHSSRSEYPTASSLLDQADETRVVGVLLFLAWATGGWRLVHKARST